MDKPKVSVIVPIYKVQKYLMQCIESILSQTLQEIEVILIDEGDLDECRAIIDMYEIGPKKDPRVIAIHEKNGGYGASANKGLDIAKGEYISIIESDDFIEPDMFKEMYEYAKKLDADIVKTPYFEYFDKTANSEEINRPCPWLDWVKDVPENKVFSIKEYPIFMGIHPSVWSCIYKKDYIDQYNIRFITGKGAYVDHYFKAESLLNTEKICWLNKAFYHYRLTNGNASAANFNISVMIKRWNEFHKLIQNKYKDLYPYFAEYNLREEYINTYRECIKRKAKLTEEDCKLLQENLSYISEDTIKNAKNIKKIDILRLLIYKKLHKNQKEENNTNE